MTPIGKEKRPTTPGERKENRKNLIKKQRIEGGRARPFLRSAAQKERGEKKGVHAHGKRDAPTLKGRSPLLAAGNAKTITSRRNVLDLSGNGEHREKKRKKKTLFDSEREGKKEKNARRPYPGHSIICKGKKGSVEGISSYFREGKTGTSSWREEVGKRPTSGEEKEAGLEQCIQAGKDVRGNSRKEANLISSVLEEKISGGRKKENTQWCSQKQRKVAAASLRLTFRLPKGKGLLEKGGHSEEKKGCSVPVLRFEA